MNFENYNTAVHFISHAQQISLEDSFGLSKYCSSLLRKKASEKAGRDILIRILDVMEKVDERTSDLWNDLTEAAGLYPYMSTGKMSRSGILRYECHKSPHLEDVYLHAEQQQVALDLFEKKSVVISAPTSFGKSLLIEEIVASGIYRNIVIIQPTLALLDETRKKLTRYRKQYKLILSTAQEPAEQTGNIFIFTGERVVEYSHFQTIDFFVIDEFYKLSLTRDDDRAVALNQALYKLLKFTNKFYMLGPNIKSIPISFSSRFELVWFPTDFATVAVDEVSMEISAKLKANEKKRLKTQRLFDLLVSSSDQTLIYCSSPNRATSLGLEFIQYLEEHLIQPDIPVELNADMNEWINRNIHPKWSLSEALKLGIAFHHGALPRHLGSSIVDAFNSGSVRWLFCTSTLIEGVNTSAKSVVLFDKEKGRQPIDFFDYKNIAGRSGRMNRHFTGKVIRFEPQPAQMDLFVDIPLFDQHNAPLEILIGMEETDLLPEAKNRVEIFQAYDEDLKNLLKANSGISVEGQLKIIELIENNLDENHRLLNWNKLPPAFDNLSRIIELCWETLAGPGDKPFVEKIGRLSARWLTTFTFSYSTNKSVRQVIRQYINDDFWKERIPDQQERIDIASFTILHITRHWFDYKLPKWLNVVSNIQEYVFKKHGLPIGNYSFFAANIEHGFLSPQLASLMEYGIPISAIQKLGSVLNQKLTPEEMLQYARTLGDQRLRELGLINYEIQKLHNAL